MSADGYAELALAIVALTVTALAAVKGELQGRLTQGLKLCLCVAPIGALAAGAATVLVDRGEEVPWALNTATVAGVVVALFVASVAGWYSVSSVGQYGIKTVVPLAAVTAIAVAVLGGLVLLSVDDLPGERIDVADDPRAVAIGTKWVWVIHKGGEVTRIDPETFELLDRLIGSQSLVR